MFYGGYYLGKYYEPLKISEDLLMKRKFGKYPVLFLDFKNFVADNYEDTIEKFQLEI